MIKKVYYCSKKTCSPTVKCSLGGYVVENISIFEVECYHLQAGWQLLVNHKHITGQPVQDPDNQYIML